MGLILLAVDLLVAGFCWLRPLGGWKSAVGWGALGGFCALVNPIVALTYSKRVDISRASVPDSGIITTSAMMYEVWIQLISSGLADSPP